jgi:glycosyltransferase involved in cell wall biosynthesis
MDKILLFIPAYNCEKQITRVLGQIDKTICRLLTEVIVINNRSTDGTEAAVLAFKNSHPEINIKLFRNRENYNLGGSHKVAFDYAVKNGFDYVIVLHGDDQGDIHDVITILQTHIHHDYDCLLGSRFMKGSRTGGYSKFRVFGNLVFNLIFSIATLSIVRDLGSGLNVYKVSILRDKFFIRFPDALLFNCFMLFANSVYNIKGKYFPISWREDDQISNVKMLSQATDTLRFVLKFMFSNKKKFIKREFRTKPTDNYIADEINGD